MASTTTALRTARGSRYHVHARTATTLSLGETACGVMVSAKEEAGAVPAHSVSEGDRCRREGCAGQFRVADREAA